MHLTDTARCPCHPRPPFLHSRVDDSALVPLPVRIDLKKDEGLTIEWADGVTSFYPILHLRRMSPSAEAREQRKELARNPLTVLKTSGAAGAGAGGGPLHALAAELVGNYALRIAFSDGHRTGIYSWRYLREIDPGAMGSRQ